VYQVEVYARVRRAVQVDGMSIRQAAREFGLARKTIRRMLEFSLPPGYRRKKPVQRPKLGPWLGIIDQTLSDDRSQPKKQRHTAKRVWDRLKAEHSFDGCYTVVRIDSSEMCMHLSLQITQKLRAKQRRTYPLFDRRTICGAIGTGKSGSGGV
jgi:hypothetical protein